MKKTKKQGYTLSRKQDQALVDAIKKAIAEMKENRKHER